MLYLSDNATGETETQVKLPLDVCQISRRMNVVYPKRRCENLNVLSVD